MDQIRRVELLSYQANASVSVGILSSEVPLAMYAVQFDRVMPDGLFDLRAQASYDDQSELWMFRQSLADVRLGFSDNEVCTLSGESSIWTINGLDLATLPDLAISSLFGCNPIEEHQIDSDRNDSFGVMFMTWIVGELAVQITFLGNVASSCFVSGRDVMDAMLYLEFVD
jgi:hypothetical protein